MKKQTDPNRQLKEQIGFDPQGSEAVKDAFVKFLKKEARTHSSNVAPVQLSQNQMQFDFMNEPSRKSVKTAKIS